MDSRAPMFRRRNECVTGFRVPVPPVSGNGTVAPGLRRLSRDPRLTASTWSGGIAWCGRRQRSRCWSAIASWRSSQARCGGRGTEAH